MAEKPPQAKSVLGALPAERPERIGAPRNGAVKPRAARPQPKRDAKPPARSPAAAKAPPQPARRLPRGGAPPPRAPAAAASAARPADGNRTRDPRDSRHRST